jgi:hypothetical protein
MNTGLTWFKSTYSNASGGDCIEIAACPDLVHVRDSKLRDGGQLAVPAGSWADFVAFARRG